MDGIQILITTRFVIGTYTMWMLSNLLYLYLNFNTKISATNYKHSNIHTYIQLIVAYHIQQFQTI